MHLRPVLSSATAVPGYSSRGVQGSISILRLRLVGTYMKRAAIIPSNVGGPATINNTFSLINSGLSLIILPPPVSSFDDIWENLSPWHLYR